MVRTGAPQELEPEKERILPPQARAVPTRVTEVREKVQDTFSQQQKAAERVVGMTAQLFAGAVADDPKLKMAVRDSQLNTLLEMVKS